jgi:RNA polymerase primary sigma factor
MIGEDASVRIYLVEIKKTSLLTTVEEAELAARIKDGDMAARDLMIRSNLLLVVKIAHEFVNCGLPFLDLVSYGNIGLMRAIDRFDPEKGGFSYFAAVWIKQQIRRALSNQSRLVRLPCHLIDRLSKVRRASAQMTQELGREPTDDELAEETGLSRGKVAQLRADSCAVASLDAPAGEDNSTKLSELIRDQDARSPDDLLQEKDRYHELSKALERLSERERVIIERRFGLNGHNGKRSTLDELGEVFGVSRERARQVEEIALVRLRRALVEREMPSFNGHRLPQ